MFLPPQELVMNLSRPLLALRIFYDLTPAFASFTCILFLLFCYFSFKSKYSPNVYYINFSLLVFFTYFVLKYAKLTSYYFASSGHSNYYFYLNFNSFFHTFSFYVHNYSSIYLFSLFFIVLLCTSFFNINKNTFFQMPQHAYIKYHLVLHITFLILVYMISTADIINSMTLMNIIIVLECFTLLTIYLTASVNINILNNLIIYFFYSVIGYLFFTIGIVIYLYIFGTDLVNVIYSYFNIYYFNYNIKFAYMIQFANLLFFISFGLKLYVFPFSNVIDKLYNSIKMLDILIISFVFVPMVYIIFIQFLAYIGWFSQSIFFNSMSAKLILFVISILTFIYSITTSIDKNNLKSLIAYSSINTSSFFLILAATSFYIYIDWWTYFFIYQITYLFILFIFIMYILVADKKSIKQNDFVTIALNLINHKLSYTIFLLFLISITMMLPPLFFFKIEMIISFFYLNPSSTLSIYYLMYFVILILYSTSSYILYIRIFRFFKLSNIHTKLNTLYRKRRQLLHYYSKK